ncbi:putative F-box/LRR-repeat protein At5g38386 [Coffea eugenioides]|uniref:putative F-box/LRR-repeat protein At5g38386 n=1 Tax=Coffea eugenioides TaxID=49369 RepID=UPI000F611F74|nr:putative F-box/LRR-repeat protein At5g38386 [Coffea eugenioides]
MPAILKNLDGRVALPILALAGCGVAIGVAIECSQVLRGKTIAFLDKHRKDFPLKVASGFSYEDRISQLPDHLLSDILLRLDLIEAVRTRILSKRWKDICKLMSKLNFDCCKMFGEIEDHGNYSFKHKGRFLKAVDQSLRLYSGQHVPYFILTCCLGKEFANVISRWMQSIAALGVEELLIKFCSPIHVDKNGNGSLVKHYPFPFELFFEAASLKNLHLFACVLRPSFKGQFKSLQFLTLMDIIGVHLRLKFLFIESCHGVKEIDISAGNLTFFYCYTDEVIKHSLRFVPELENLSLSCNGSGTVPHLFSEVAKDCTQLKQLLFQTKTDELECIPLKMDMFSNLKILYLLIMFDSNNWMTNSKVDLLNLTPILDACPLLEQFRLLARCPGRNAKRGGAWPPRHHAHLKEMEFDGFRGTMNEIAFASFLLRSASELERLCIRSSYSTYFADFTWTEHPDLRFTLRNARRYTNN